MPCISPILVNRVVNSRNSRDYVPCGKCNECLKLKRNDWSFRLRMELNNKHTVAAHFLTFTYDDDHLPRNPESGLSELRKRDVQLFMKRLRKASASCSDIPIRYYTVGEYGTQKGRPHYHSIMFNLHPHVVTRLDRIWQGGIIHAGSVTPESIAYVTKYVINRHGEYAGREPPFSLMSKKPGIGAGYLDSHSDWHRDGMRGFVQVNGVIARLPRYYKDKIFTQSERRAMGAQSIRAADEAFNEEIDRLSEFQEDPYDYMDQLRVDKHDRVFSKLNDTNKF